MLLLMKYFNSEKKFEQYLAMLIKRDISKAHPNIYALNAKKAVDLVICKNGKHPKLFFLEVKYFNKNKNHSMVGFGGAKGTGFQPAVLKQQPDYFKKHLMWVMGSALHDGIYFLDMCAVMKHLSGSSIGKKQNGFRRSIFDNEESLDELQFIAKLKQWLGI